MLCSISKRKINVLSLLSTFYDNYTFKNAGNICLKIKMHFLVGLQISCRLKLYKLFFFFARKLLWENEANQFVMATPSPVPLLCCSSFRELCLLSKRNADISISIVVEWFTCICETVASVLLEYSTRVFLDRSGE